MTQPLLTLLEGRYLVMDHSTLASIEACARMGAYKRLHKRVPVRGEEAQHAGRCVHAGMQARYGGVPLGDATVMGDAVEKLYGTASMPLDDYRTLERLREVMRLYAEHYEGEALAPLGVELPFACVLGEIELPEGFEAQDEKGVRLHPTEVTLVWTGRIDLVARFGDHVMIVDHKTMNDWRVGNVVQFENSGQFKGYAWAVGEMSAGFDSRFDCQLPYAISKQMQPHLSKWTPFEAWDGPLRPHGFVLNAIVMRKPAKTERATLPRNEFHRHQCFYSDAHIAEWKQNTLAKVEAWLGHYARGFFPMNDGHVCAAFYGKACPFLDVCVAPPEQRALVLSTDLYIDNTWSPLATENAEA